MTFRGSDHPDELLSASLTGDLSAEERTRLDHHLADCTRCRDELDALAADRQALGSMRNPPAPRDLEARVRAGIEPRGSRRTWFVGLGASLATVIAAIAVVALIVRPPDEPGGSPAPSASGSAVESPSAVPATPEPSPAAAFLAPGDMGYLVLRGEVGNQQLVFRNDRTGAEITAPTTSGAILAAALSPDAQWLAYISQKGESGATETWVLSLSDGESFRLGCSAQFPFTDRLAWSGDSSVLAYTLAAIDLGTSVGCRALETAPSSTDVWLFETDSRAVRRLTESGDAYAAAFVQDINSDAAALLVSHATTAESSTEPWTEMWKLTTSAPEPIHLWDGVFLPLFGSDQVESTEANVLFYVPLFAPQTDGLWNLQGGGVPLIGTGSYASETIQGTPAISPGTAGSSLTEWRVSWSPDGQQFAAWSATSNAPFVLRPQAALAGGHVDPITIDVTDPSAADGWIQDVAFADGEGYAVTYGLPSAGIGDPPSSVLMGIDFPSSGAQVGIGESGANPPWTGPAVFAP
jgi:Putative zinc-finger/WD40-like Beta Propeller Repeat